MFITVLDLLFAGVVFVVLACSIGKTTSRKYCLDFLLKNLIYASLIYGIVPNVPDLANKFDFNRAINAVVWRQFSNIN